MDQKKSYALSLLLVLGLQFLPLKQLVCWMISNPVTEEIVHAQDGSTKMTGADEVHKYLRPENGWSLHDITQQSNPHSHPWDESMNQGLAEDPPTPPPNS